MRVVGHEMRDLPRDPEVLQALLWQAVQESDRLAREHAAIVAERDRLGREHAAIVAERDSIARERDELHLRHQRLLALLAKLQRGQFGRKSERLPEEQLQFAFEELEASLSATGAATVPDQEREKRVRSDRKGPKRRGKLPSHLPRIEEVILPAETCCPCCRGEMVTIGEDVSERLDVIPAQFRVLVTKRPKLACRACGDKVVQAPAPARLVEGGLPTEATVAHVLVSRYADHLPLYRQSQMLARQGLEIGRDVLASWVGLAAAELAPVVERLHWRLLQAERLFADETPLPVLDPGRGKTKTGYAWTLVRDDRPWGGTTPPAAVFRYAPGRGQEEARRLLRGFAGQLQCDGYGAYKALTRDKEGPVLSFCWAHLRRQFYDLAMGGAAPIATEALQRIAELYRIETELRGRPPDQRREIRQARSRPLVEKLFAWLEEQYQRVPGRSPTGEAIRYALRHRDGLVRFLENGILDIDNNAAERAIRPLALGRKNALFASGDDGGERWAMIASLIETCKLNGVDPQRYLTEVLTRLANRWPNSRIDELMPWHWAKTNPA